jgi:hypothetical protein
MSVWPAVTATSPSLAGTEGALVSVSVSVDPPRLEELLDALAQLEFPINPQIYHEASLIYGYPDNHEEEQPTTLVEFPAYESHLPEIERILAFYGFPPGSVHATAMLEELHSESLFEEAPPGSPYCFRIRRKHAAAAA